MGNLNLQMCKFMLFDSSTEFSLKFDLKNEYVSAYLEDCLYFEWSHDLVEEFHSNR